MFHNKKILITGGTGTFGKAFVYKTLSKYNPKKIAIYSRDEHKQYEMKKDPFFKKHFKKLSFLIGDVRDGDRVDSVIREGYDFVVHAAAIKHIDIAENNPYETVKTNIFGTHNIIESCTRHNVKKIVVLSTDKAVSPKNLYGATKLVLEKMVTATNNYNNSTQSKFAIVRYGNVTGSRGSVIPFFLKQKENGFLPLTDINSTRFNIEIEDAVIFVFKTFNLMEGGEIFIPKMKSYKLIDLANAIVPKIKIIETGLRPGEKLHESLIASEELSITHEFKDFFAIVPDSETRIWSLKKFCKKNNIRLVKNQRKEEYNSLNNKFFLKKNELLKLVNKIKKNY